MLAMQKHHRPAFFLIMLLIAAACQPATPVAIFVTPTPEAAVSTTVVPTFVSPDTIPTIDSAIVPTISLSTVTASATPTLVQTILGPVVGTDYTVPPTNTPRPTLTPTEAPTEFIPPTATREPGTPLPGLDRSRLGVQMDYNMDVGAWATTLFYAQQIKVDWVKLQANWKFMQPNRPDEFEQSFRLFQLHVQEADKQGFKVLISIAKAPDWTRNVNRNEDGPPDDLGALVTFINMLFDKIGPHIDAIEIWNEPNLPREWTGAHPMTGAGYMRLFDVAYQAIRARDPGMPIITAGLAPTRAPGAVDDRLFLQQMYDAGLGSYQNVAVGVHPYSWGNPPDARCCNAVEGQGWDDDPHFFFSHNIEDYRQIMVRNNHGAAQMWLTEFGWATWDNLPGDPPDEWMRYNTTEDQINFTIRAFEIGQSLDYIGGMFLWNLNFANEILIDRRDEIAGYSLFLPNEIRPLYEVLRTRP